MAPPSGPGRPSLFVVGCRGYVGSAVAAVALRRGGGYRHAGGAALRGDADRDAAVLLSRGALGVVVHEVPAQRAAAVDALLAADAVVCCAEGGEEYAEALRRAASAAPPPPVVYVSTTGVYARDAGVVDEHSAATALPERLAAEEAWRENAGAAVLRLGGVYGPGEGRSVLGSVAGRGAVPSASRRRRAAHPYTPRIHVADAAGAVLAALAALRDGRLGGGAVLNVVDEDDAPRHAAVAFAAGLLGVEPPPPPPPCPPLPDGASPRRVRRDAALRDALGYSLLYPSYREGLAAIHAGDAGPFA